MHTGEIVKNHIDARGWTISRAARELDINRVNLSRFLSGKAGLSVCMAVKVEEVFGISGMSLLAKELQGEFDRVQKAERSKRNFDHHWKEDAR